MIQRVRYEAGRDETTNPTKEVSMACKSKAAPKKAAKPVKKTAKKPAKKK